MRINPRKKNQTCLSYHGLRTLNRSKRPHPPIAILVTSLTKSPARAELTSPGLVQGLGCLREIPRGDRGHLSTHICLRNIGRGFDGSLVYSWVDEDSPKTQNPNKKVSNYESAELQAQTNCEQMQAQTMSTKTKMQAQTLYTTSYPRVQDVHCRMRCNRRGAHATLL